MLNSIPDDFVVRDFFYLLGIAMEIIKNIFYNSDERRVRTLIRIPLFFAVFILAMLLQRMALSPLRDVVPYFRLISAPVSVILFSFVIWFTARFIDRRKIADYGIFYSKEWVLDFVFGLLLGIFLISFVFVFEYSLGWITIVDYCYAANDKNFILALLESVFLYIYVGYYEETLSRGYLLKNISEGMNFKKTGPIFAIIFAVLFTSFLFGLGHADNPNATFNGWWNIIIVGSLLAYTFVITKSLAIPIGIHITWNFFQGSVYGFPVSGNPTSVTFLQIHQGGNSLWTGGDFGPEAGLVIYFVAVFWLILLHIWLHFWKRSLIVDKNFAGYTSDTSD
jgi:uncharacterized protein